MSTWSTTAACIIAPTVDGHVGPQLMIRALDISAFLADVAAAAEQSAEQGDEVCAPCILRACAARFVDAADQLTP